MTILTGISFICMYMFEIMFMTMFRNENMSIKEEYNLGDGELIGRARTKEDAAIRAVKEAGDTGVSLSVLRSRLKLGRLDAVVKTADWLVDQGYAVAVKADRKYAGRDVVKLRWTGKEVAQ